MTRSGSGSHPSHPDNASLARNRPERTAAVLGSSGTVPGPAAPMTELEQKCRDAVACVEVTARVEAGQRAIHELDLSELGHQLLAQAQRFAEVHGHGAGPAELEGAR